MTARSLEELKHWHARHIEEIVDPSRRIVDAHHHLWLRPPEAYQLPELLSDMNSGHDVRATVFVQNTAMYRADGPELLKPVGETEYVNGMAAMSASGIFGPQRLCAGIVSWADLRDPAVARLLDRHREAASSRFKGIRQQAQLDPYIGSTGRLAPPGDLLRGTAFRRGFSLLGEAGHRFDAWVSFTQLHELDELAACAETPIVLNHLGGPLGIGHYASRRHDVFEAWAEGINALARRPNVSVKLGGLGMPCYGFGFELREAPASSAELSDAWRPYIEHCIERFGAHRCMFESNFPVDKVTASYRTLWNAFKLIAADASEDEQAALFDGTARRIYDLGEQGLENNS